MAGTVSTDSAVRVRITAVGEETTLAGIRRLVEEAQSSRSRAQALADRAAALLFYVALASAVVTVVAWLAIGEPDQAVERTITVLVIACPHALGLAIPLVIAISTTTSAKVGILIKDRLALERMRTVDTVLMDKTGTLTTGRPTVRAVIVDGGDEDSVLSLASAVEADSEHPLARAIVEEARRRGLRVPAASGFRSMAGRGVHAIVDGAEVAVGGPALLRELELDAPPWLTEPTRRGGTAGRHRPHRRQGRQTHRLDRARGCGSSGIPPSGAGPASGRAPRHDDHGRRTRGRRRDRRGPGHRRGPRRGPAGGQGIGRRRAPGGRATRGDGRRRRERRAGARSRRCGHRDRRGHRRRDRIRRRGARERRPAQRPERVAPLARQLREDDPEPRVGHGVQRARHPPGGGSPRSLGIRASSCRRRGRDEPVHDRRRVQRPAPQAAGSPSEGGPDRGRPAGTR